ncbi:MAG TPA: hypothetical protein VD905_02045 [Flavobacteriales bacterium]|nr:hypothetical protein [Flavobacteriales bacterium]
MKNWKVIIDYKGKRMEITVEAVSYPDAYVNTEIQYPGCTIISITEIRDK